MASLSCNRLLIKNEIYIESNAPTSQEWFKNVNACVRIFLLVNHN